MLNSTTTRNPVQHLQQENSRLRDENRDLLAENKSLRATLEALLTLHEVAISITPTTDVMILLDRILEVSLQSIGASDGSLLLVNEELTELVFVVVHGRVRDQLTGYRIPIGTGIAGWVVQNEQPLIVPNVNLDPRFSHLVDTDLDFQTRSILCVPLHGRDNILGVIQAVNKTNGNEFSPQDLSLLRFVADLAAIAMTKAEEAYAIGES
jgi:phosphoserine phosphatase RsbU/P